MLRTTLIVIALLTGGTALAQQRTNSGNQSNPTNEMPGSAGQDRAQAGQDSNSQPSTGSTMDDTSRGTLGRSQTGTNMPSTDPNSQMSTSTNSTDTYPPSTTKQKKRSTKPRL